MNLYQFFDEVRARLARDYGLCSPDARLETTVPERVLEAIVDAWINDDSDPATAAFLAAQAIQGGK